MVHVAASLMISHGDELLLASSSQFFMRAKTTGYKIFKAEQRRRLLACWNYMLKGPCLILVIE